MRHGKKNNHLSRKTGHRKALLKNLAINLIEHKRINTTLAKAKALRKYVEPLVTKGKTNSTHSRRVVFSYLQNKEAVEELFTTIAEKVADRPGGYVRVIKTGYRKGDAAEIAMIEFVDFNTLYSGASSTAGAATTKKKRTRRGKSKTSDTATDKSTDTSSAKKTTAATAVTTAAAATTAKVVETKAEVVEKVVETKAEVVEKVVEKVEPVKADVKETVEATPEKVVAAEPDDLKKIEGIGPKIAEILNAAGITTFAKLADTTPDKIKELMTEAGPRFASHDPTTWPKQSKMAADGEWEALEKWQDELDGGKVVD